MLHTDCPRKDWTIVISISRNGHLKSFVRFIIELCEIRKKHHNFKSVHFVRRMVLFSIECRKEYFTQKLSTLFHYIYMGCHFLTWFFLQIPLLKTHLKIPLLIQEKQVLSYWLILTFGKCWTLSRLVIYRYKRAQHKKILGYILSERLFR